MTALLVLLLFAHAWADDDEASVAPVTDRTWTAECGACHLAYPPGLLPARSWEALLADLEQHFGEDASLDPPTRERLRSWAVANAADRSPAPLSRFVARASSGATPLRISTLPALRAEHLEEVSPGRVGPTGAVRSWASCASCHPGAASGVFDD